jgi:5,10-methenyltetrahydrofolate synthetase
LSVDRRELRRELRARRRAIGAGERLAAADAAARHLADQPGLRGPGYIAGYWAVDGELPLHFVQLRLAPGQVWCLPCLQDDGSLRFAPWRPGDALKPNRYGIPEPDVAPSSTLAGADLAVVLMPLLGFDAAAASSRRRRLRLPGGGAARARGLGCRPGRRAHRTRLARVRAIMPAMKYWLMKSEPDTFSIDDLARVGTEPWTGVRNYQARNFMRQMRVGDGVLFYHSSCAVPAVVGVAEVAAEAFPDPTQFDWRSPYHDPKATPAEPRWWCVDVRYVRHVDPPVTLAAMRAEDRLEGLALLQRGSRLSVLPVTSGQWKTILSLAA